MLLSLYREWEAMTPEERSALSAADHADEETRERVRAETKRTLLPDGTTHIEFPVYPPKRGRARRVQSPK
jgi:hypothetical protein